MGMGGEHDASPLVPLSEFVGCLGDLVGQVGGQEEGLTLTVTDLTIQLPFELEVRVDESGDVALASATPERTETSYRPMLHGLKVGIVLDHGES
jgi:hypothetical protein